MCFVSLLSSWTFPDSQRGPLRSSFYAERTTMITGSPWLMQMFISFGNISKRDCSLRTYFLLKNIKNKEPNLLELGQTWFLMLPVCGYIIASYDGIAIFSSLLTKTNYPNNSAWLSALDHGKSPCCSSKLCLFPISSLVLNPSLFWVPFI